MNEASRAGDGRIARSRETARPVRQRRKVEEKMRKLLAAALFAATSIYAFGAQAVDLRLSVETPPGHVRNLASERWAEAIEKNSNGEINVDVFPGGQLYDSAGAIRALASGALDLSVQASPTLSQFEPNLSVITLPMFFGATREQVRTILDGPIGDELYAKVATKGIVVPDGGQFEFAPNNSAYTVDSKPVTNFNELAGVKLATPPSPVVVAILKAMGANPVATPRTEIVMQLTQGQIDGMGSVTDLTISGGKLWEAGIKHAFADNAGWGTYLPLVSKASLDKLTPEQQKIVLDSWKDVVGWARDHAAAELDKAIEANKANGVTYHEPSKADVDAIRAKLVEEQDKIVSSSGMDAEFVAKVKAALEAL
jgi:TRAP-type transport system periplasmic protein